jgi:hypothetical protein
VVIWFSNSCEKLWGGGNDKFNHDIYRLMDIIVTQFALSRERVAGVRYLN